MIVIGILPGTDGSLSCYPACNDAKRRSKEPETFGKDNPDGVAASECGNGTDDAGSLIPAPSLGIPGSGVATVILGGLLVHGLRPGPQLFNEHPDGVYGFMIQMLLSALLPLGGLAATRIFCQALRLPPVVLAPMILLFVTVGLYAVNNAMLGLYTLLLIGSVADVLDRLGYPSAPIIPDMILGPIAESELSLAPTMSGGNPAAPISSLLLILPGPLRSMWKDRRRVRSSAEAASLPG